MRPLNRSRRATASSRIPRSTLSRSSGERTAAASGGGEAVGTVVRGVVEEVLLELVEDQEQPAAGPRGAAPDRRLERPACRAVAVAPRKLLRHLAGEQVAGAIARLPPVDRRRERRHRVLAPAVEQHDRQSRAAQLGDVARRLLLQPVHHARAEHGALADAALAVEQGQARGLEVVREDVRPHLAP